MISVSSYVTTYPWLSGVVPDVPDRDTGLFPDLTLDGVLKCLSRFHESSECGEEPTREFTLQMP
jgi:hypothetical protein